MANPLKLLIDVSTGTQTYVPMTDAEYAQEQADAALAAQQAAADANANTNAATIRAELQSQMATALALADKLDANTATPAEQRAALSLCLHAVVRLGKVVYRTFDVPA